MTKKYSTSTYLTVLSNRTVKKSREGGGGGEVVAGGKKMDEYLKLKWEKRKNISKTLQPNLSFSDFLLLKNF